MIVIGEKNLPERCSLCFQDANIEQRIRLGTFCMQPGCPLNKIVEEHWANNKHLATPTATSNIPSGQFIVKIPRTPNGILIGTPVRKPQPIDSSIFFSFAGWKFLLNTSCYHLLIFRFWVSRIVKCILRMFKIF